MSCIVPDTELADKNIIKELGAITDGEVRGYSFVLRKSTNPKKNNCFGEQEICIEMCGTVQEL